MGNNYKNQRRKLFMSTINLPAFRLSIDCRFFNIHSILIFLEGFHWMFCIHHHVCHRLVRWRLFASFPACLLMQRNLQRLWIINLSGRFTAACIRYYVPKAWIAATNWMSGYVRTSSQIGSWIFDWKIKNLLKMFLL